MFGTVYIKDEVVVPPKRITVTFNDLTEEEAGVLRALLSTSDDFREGAGIKHKDIVSRLRTATFEGLDDTLWPFFRKLDPSSLLKNTRNRK